MKVERTERGLSIDIASEEETVALGQALAQVVVPGVVIGLTGPLGAGKTRLVRALAEALGVEPSTIASPTFVLIHEYEGRMPVYHFDTYRLGNPDEFDDLGASDYWNPADGVCLVEWADRVADRLPDETWAVEIEPIGPISRRVLIRFPYESPMLDRLATCLGRFDA